MTQLTEYLRAAHSAYHVVWFTQSVLEDAGFEELDLRKGFDLKAGGKYYCSPYPTSLFAFRVGKKIKSGSMHIACAHTDSPTFRVKPAADLGEKSGTFRINVEPYGGSLKRTWFDRPLGLAGTVLVRGKNPYQPSRILFDSEEPWFVIPSLAPHMDREIEEKKLDPQKELIPLYAVKDGDEETDFLSALAVKAGVEKEEILDYDLSLYLCEEPAFCGLNGELLLASRIDNVASVAALTEGLIAASGTGKTQDQNDISLIALYDNEEIGSRTKQGADSGILNAVIDRIFASKLLAGISREDALFGSRILSVDGAHAVHPNYAEKADETAKAFLGQGVVLKTSAAQRYVTDPEMGAVLTELCIANGIRLQRQANRSGSPGGQTLGPIVSSYLPIPAADLGIPMLGMHSSKETMCLRDQEDLLKLAQVWLES